MRGETSGARTRGVTACGRRQAIRACWMLAGLFVRVSFGDANAQTAKRTVAMRDIIGMTRLADPLYLQGGPSKGRLALFSPDGTKFLIPTTRGNLEKNTNEYSLFLFRTARVFSDAKHAKLFTLASSSNRPAIAELKWLNNHSFAFLGESAGRLPQVYCFDLRTGRLEQLTGHPTAVVAYDMTVDGKKILYAAEARPRKLTDTSESRRNGILVDTTTFLHLLGNGRSGYDPTPTQGEEIYLKAKGGAPVRISLEDRFFPNNALSLSPDGRYALIEAYVVSPPKAWALYEDRRLRQIVAAAQNGDTTFSLRRYSLLDLNKRTAEPFLDSPTEERAMAFHWMPDSRSVLVSGAFLPLDATDESERQHRQQKSFVLEVKVPGHEYTILSDKSLKLSQWSPDLRQILLENPYPWKNEPSATYERDSQGWHKIHLQRIGSARQGLPDIVLAEGMNDPPKVLARDIGSGRETLLLDLNPQFAALQFAKEEIFSWNVADGHTMKGGLYFPLGYTAGNRYPLVIQTHGFLSERFWPDGPWSSAFAAQALAAKGMFVLQIGTSDDAEADREAVNTPRGASREMAAYEGAIDELDRSGLIDADRVGIIGFSRTVYHVGYSLAHSTHRFRAATLADGMDGGYFQYVLAPYLSPDAYLVNGGRPFKKNLFSWMANAPAFSAEKVETPVRIEAYGSFGYLSAWEWYRRLTEQAKPVELLFLPDAAHLLVKPWERLASQDGNVDWFVFWLKGEEDPDPAKAEQYKRWRELKKLRTESQKSNATESNPEHIN